MAGRAYVRTPHSCILTISTKSQLVSNHVLHLFLSLYIIYLPLYVMVGCSIE